MKRNGYEFLPMTGAYEHHGLLAVKKLTDGSLVRELPFEFKGDEPTDEEVETAIKAFFDNIGGIDTTK